MELKFGTDGIRTHVGSDPLNMTNLAKVGYALGKWIIKKHGENALVLICDDTRKSAHWIKTTLNSGLLLWPVEVEDAGTLPTPALVALLQHKKNHHIGIIISASHNPYLDNGLKIVDQELGKLPAHEEQQISAYFIQEPAIKYQQFGQLNMVHVESDYIDIICSFFTKNFLSGLRIALDCAHGATSTVAPKIFKKLGATVITVNNEPNGTNINNNSGSQFPEQLINTVLQTESDIGFAFDGDGDRLIAVTKKGNLKDGDDILAFLSQHPVYSSQKFFVGTVMSNQGLAHYFQQQQKQFIRTAVGDKYIIETLKANKTIIGAEPSGHVILADYLFCSDGIFAALRILETILYTKNWSLNSFEKFPQVIINCTIRTKKDLNSAPISDIIAASRADLPNGRVLVRYSGTEPLLRIMVENNDKTEAERVANWLYCKLSQELS